MIDKDKNDILACFFLMEKELYVDFYLFGNNYTYSYEKYKYNSNSYKDIECIKSVANNDRSKALVSLYSKTGELKSFAFNINTKTIYSIKINDNFKGYYCKQNYFSLNVYHFKETDEFINSCLDNFGNILVEYYNVNLTVTKHKIRNYGKDNLYGYSILYSNCTKDYFLISQEEPFKLLFGDNEELENIKKNTDNLECLMKQNSEGVEGNDDSKDPDKSDDGTKPYIIIIIVLICFFVFCMVGFLIFFKLYKKKELNKDIIEKIDAPILFVTPQSSSVKLKD